MIKRSLQKLKYFYHILVIFVKISQLQFEFLLLKISMHANLDKEDEDILQTIDLTSKLQQSLRKLLTKKKSFDTDIFAFHSPKHQKQESNLHIKLQALEQQNKQLYLDNQQLSKQLLSVKEQLRQCKKQLASTKKYLAFLQQYNDDLKKQMLFWMKNKKEESIANETSSVGGLMAKIIKLRKENEENQKKLLSLKETVDMKAEHAYSQSLHNKSLNFDLSKFENQFIRRKKSMHKESKSNFDNPCTSCNYKAKSKNNSKNKQKHMQVSSSYNLKNRQGSNSYIKGKNLRKWHNHYVSSSEFTY